MHFFSKIWFRLTLAVVAIWAFSTSVTAQSPNADALQINDAANCRQTALHSRQDKTSNIYRNIRNCGLAALDAN